MSTDTIQHWKFGAPILASTLALLMLLGTGCSEKDTPPPQETAQAQAPASQMTEPDAPEPAAPEPAAPEPAAPEPAAPEPAAESPADTPAASADGQKIYQTSCQACHAAGIAGAPKLGDKDAWAPRIAKGNDAMFASVKNGLKAMPPKGTCMSCSDDELRVAMEYMVGEGS